MFTPNRSKFLILISSAIVLGFLTYILGWSSLLSVDKITITGTPTAMSQIKVQNAIDISSGDKLARVNPRAIENRLMEFPWIESVGISRHWLSGEISIDVIARTPLAQYLTANATLKWIDGTGKIFSMPGGVSKELPQVEADKPQSALEGAALFTQLPLETRDLIKKINADRLENFVITMEFRGREIRVLWGNIENTDLKIAVLKKLLLLPENKQILMVDLTAPHAPIVK